MPIALSRSTKLELKERIACAGVHPSDFAKFDSPFKPQFLTSAQIVYTAKNLLRLLTNSDQELIEDGKQPSANARLQLMNHFPDNLRYT